MSINYATGEIIDTLTEDEAARLRVKERAIERGADEVAKALASIRDERLYRADFPTFEAYCRERWGMSRTHADRQIVAAEVAEALAPIGAKVPESQARELADLRDNPEKLREVYTQAQEATEGNVTAAAIREVRNPSQTPQGEAASDDAAATPDDESDSEPQSERPVHPRPAVTGIDGKTYPKPEPKAAPRKPLADTARNAGWDLRKAVERIERIAADDRFHANAEQVATELRSHLQNAVEVCQDLLARIDNKKESTQ